MIDKAADIPAKVTTKKDGTVDIFVPDLKITVHSNDYVSAAARASLVYTALFLYNKEHNIKMAYNTRYEDILSKCKNGEFPTFISIEC